MKELVESILQKEYTKANELFSEQINSVVSRKLTEAKKMYAAKMSVGEQLNVDKRGNYDETGGRDVILSHEKQKRGLTEGDVVSIGGSVHKTKNYTVSVGKSDNDPVVVHHESSGTKTRITHPDARAYVARIVDKRKLNDNDVDNLKSNYKPEPMKEEAKKAALSIVAKREETPEEKVKRFLGALEGPGRLKTSEKPKLVNKNVSEEKIHNEKGEHLGNVMEITGSHAKDPTKKIKKFRAERKDGKTLITANKKAAHEFLENK